MGQGVSFINTSKEPVTIRFSGGQGGQFLGDWVLKARQKTFKHVQEWPSGTWSSVWLEFAPGTAKSKKIYLSEVDYNTAVLIWDGNTVSKN